MPRVDVQPLRGQRGDDVVAGGIGVAAGDCDLGAAGPEDQRQPGGLGLQMHAHHHAQPGERLLRHKVRLDAGNALLARSGLLRRRDDIGSHGCSGFCLIGCRGDRGAGTAPALLSARL